MAGEQWWCCSHVCSCETRTSHALVIARSLGGPSETQKSCSLSAWWRPRAEDGGGGTWVPLRLTLAAAQPVRMQGDGGCCSLSFNCHLEHTHEIRWLPQSC